VQRTGRIARPRRAFEVPDPPRFSGASGVNGTDLAGLSALQDSPAARRPRPRALAVGAGRIEAGKEGTMHRRMARTLLVVAVIATLAWGCTRTHHAEGSALHDATTTMRIKTTYLFSRHLNPFRINVDTDDGVVTIRGTVPSDVHRQLAGEIAKNAEGVTEVHNELVIAPDRHEEPESEDRTFREKVHDASLSASVKLALAFERGVKASEITVRTDRGTVTLSGEVGSWSERRLAVRVARDTEGVKDVIDRLEIRG
jgi:hyperosmotically inducible protein